MAKHSLGPWAFEEGDKERRASSRVFKAGDIEFTIAEVTCEWSNPHQRAEDIANARLMAAAPELLGSLEGVRQAIVYARQHGECLTSSWAMILDEISDEIKKATGEE